MRDAECSPLSSGGTIGSTGSFISDHRSLLGFRGLRPPDNDQEPGLSGSAAAGVYTTIGRAGSQPSGGTTCDQRRCPVEPLHHHAGPRRLREEREGHAGERIHRNHDCSGPFRSDQCEQLTRSSPRRRPGTRTPGTTCGFCGRRGRSRREPSRSSSSRPVPSAGSMPPPPLTVPFSET